MRAIAEGMRCIRRPRTRGKAGLNWMMIMMLSLEGVNVGQVIKVDWNIFILKFFQNIFVQVLKIVKLFAFKPETEKCLSLFE